jgi:hypothetical protein
MPSISYSNETPYGGQQKSDAELRRNVQAAYTQLATREEARRTSAGRLQVILKLLVKWDSDFPRETTRARNNARQVANRPLSLEQSNWGYEAQCRLAGHDLLNEQAEGERRAYEESRGEDPTEEQFRLHHNARAEARKSLRTDADEADVRRVANIGRKEIGRAGVPDNDEREERRPYLAREEA